jgi:ribonuclease P protein component
MIDEAHLPAEPPRAQAPSRLPLALGDAGRAQGAGGAPRPRPRQAERVGDVPAGRLKGGVYAVIQRRADFLAANAGRRAPMPGFVLLVRPRGDGDATMRLGITVTKKIGNAVVRNRMKRRFRALARAVLPEHGHPGADHVLIGREAGIERPFDQLGRDLAKALAKVRP